MIEPEVEKRPRDAYTDSIIQEALDEEQQQKKQRKMGKQGPAKGKTLAEIEEEEGGPVKESLLGVARAKRSDGRKAQDAADDIAMPTDVDKYEEHLTVEEEDGVQFTGFNLKDEKEAGHFDEDGNYVERKDDTEEKDAWLDSDEAKIVSEEVRKRLEEQQKAAEAAARKPPLTDRQIAALKAEVAQHMLPGETLTKALKRLGGGAQQRALGKRDKARLQQQLQQQQQQQGGSGNAALFLRFTEIADQLLDEGEMDVYDETKESLEKSAAMWLPKQPAQPPASTSAPSNGGPAAPAKPAANDDEDDDMFAEEENVLDKSQQPPAAAPNDAPASASAPPDAPPAAAAAPPTNAPNSTSKAPGPPAAAGPSTSAVDYSTWPIKELKRFLDERGVDPGGFVEKSDLVAKVTEVAAAGPEGVETFTAPPGYAFDPTSGYFYSGEADMYYDTSSGGYYKDGNWFSYDSATGQYVAWPAQ